MKGRRDRAVGAGRVVLVALGVAGIVWLAMPGRRIAPGQPIPALPAPAWDSPIRAPIVAQPAPRRGSLGGWRILAIAAGAVLAWIGVVAVRERWKAPAVPAVPAPPLRTAPARIDVPRGGQEPIGADEARWIGPDDYPRESIGLNETGAVRIRWRVGEDGAISDCGAVKSSGHPWLDRAASTAIVRHGSYRPARDAAGWPVAVTRERRVRWQLPD